MSRHYELELKVKVVVKHGADEEMAEMQVLGWLA